MNRFLPAVGAPYGIPLNVLMPCTSTPRTLPNAVSATTKSDSAAHARRRKVPDAATNRADCVMKWRRFMDMKFTPDGERTLIQWPLVLTLQVAFGAGVAQAFRLA